MSEWVKSEYTADMPEESAELSAKEVAAMTVEQHTYNEALESDAMGFYGKEGI